MKQTNKNRIRRECAIKKMNIILPDRFLLSSDYIPFQFLSVDLTVALIKWVIVYLSKKNLHWSVLTVSLLINLIWSIDRISFYISLRLSTPLMLRVKVKVKVKWSRYSPGVTQRVGRGIALLFHDRGTRRGWGVSNTPRPHFTAGKDPVPILQEAGWVPAVAQLLYRLSDPAHH